jgi:uncharacterized protein involved in exopolysaccharide biosynthesis
MQEQIRHDEARVPPTARERLARMRTLLRRGLAHWKGALIVFGLCAAAATAFAMQLKHVYRSECTILAKPRIRTDDREDASGSQEQMARQAARLKDMLTTRERLESAIKRFNLYPDTLAGMAMLDAVEQMKPHVGFRTLEAAQYVISFDGDNPGTVHGVTKYLADSLIDDYAGNELDDLLREADFLGREDERSLGGLEQATRSLTMFLAAHPEFAVEARLAATPFGANLANGIPLLPKVAKDGKVPSDPTLAGLFRERARAWDGSRAAGALSGGLVPTPEGTKPLDDAIAQATGDVDAASKRLAETQADLATKSNLTPDHPDMRAAHMAIDAATRRLHEARVELASLQQIKASGDHARVDAASVPPDVAARLHQLDMQIAARQAQLARSAAPAGSTASADGAAPAPRHVEAEVPAVVELETDWQRLLRALNEAKSSHDDIKLRAERAKLSVEAARSEAHERIAIVEPPFRPTHPSKGGRANAMIAGLGMAWLLAVAFAGVRVALDDTLFDGDDIETLALVPLLGVIPTLGPAAPASRRMEVRSDAAA